MRENEDRRWGRLGRNDEGPAGVRADQTRPRPSDSPWWRERQGELGSYRENDHRLAEATRTSGVRGYGQPEYSERRSASSAGQPAGSQARGGVLSWRPEVEGRSARPEPTTAFGQSAPRELVGPERDPRLWSAEGESPERYERESRPNVVSAGASARTSGFRGHGPRGYRRSDERVREDVCDALTEHDELDASDLDVTVSAGEVSLSGLVDDRRSKRLAEDIAASCRGVRDVHNQLRIKQRLEPSTVSGQRSGERAENPPRNRFS